MGEKDNLLLIISDLYIIVFLAISVKLRNITTRRIIKSGTKITLKPLTKLGLICELTNAKSLGTNITWLKNGVEFVYADQFKQQLGALPRVENFEDASNGYFKLTSFVQFKPLPSKGIYIMFALILTLLFLHNFTECLALYCKFV